MTPAALLVYLKHKAPILYRYMLKFPRLVYRFKSPVKLLLQSL